MSRPDTVLGWGLLVGALLTLSGVGCAAQPAAPGLSPAAERARTFGWFSTLGFPDVKGCKLVLVSTGGWYRSGSDPPRNTYLLGFVLEENGKSFSVLTLDLTTRTFRWSPPGAAEHERVGYEKLPLAKTAEDHLQALRGGPAVEQPGLRFFQAGLSTRGETFVLAWACWRHGLDGQAAALYAHAASMADRGDTGGPRPPLRQLISRDLAHTEMWRAVEAFGDPTVPRARLLKRFQRLVRNYPESEHAKRARETASLLEKMVREDAEHAKQRAARPFAKLSKDEQIADLVFRLRDQNGHQFSQPGSCNVFWTRGDKEDSPAHQLLRHGYDAVPRLIEALDDPRFTRSVEFHRNFYFSHRVLSVGDAAGQILTRIAGRSFYARADADKAPSIKDQVRAWYAELKKKGEKQLLIEATERGDGDSYSQGARLLKKYPDAALPALVAGAKAAKDGWARSSLVGLLGEVKGEGPLPFLLAELKDGPFAAGRLAAAEALHRRGRPEAVAAMIAEWQGKRPASPKGGEEGDGLQGVVGFLAGSGKVEAIEALARGLDERAVDLRLSVVSRFGEGGHLSVVTKGGGGMLNPGSRRDNAKAVRGAVEKVLLAALDDTEERTGMSGSWNGKSFSDPRICDIAGHVLNQLDPKLYPFDLEVPLAKRNRSVLALKNVLRKAHGLRPLPLPGARKVVPLPEREVLPLLERYLRGKGAGRDEAERPVLGLGLRALPVVLRRLERAGKDGDERAALLRLAGKLASCVREVVVEGRSLKPSADLVARLKALEGKPLEPRAFVLAYCSVVNRVPPGVHGLRFAAERDDDGTGITLRVDLLDAARAARVGWSAWIAPDPAAPKAQPASWNYSERVAVGTRGLRGLSGAGGRRQLEGRPQPRAGGGPGRGLLRPAGPAGRDPRPDDRQLGEVSGRLACRGGGGGRLPLPSPARRRSPGTSAVRPPRGRLTAGAWRQPGLGFGLPGFLCPADSCGEVPDGPAPLG
jgi:hypothetical protein